MLNGTCGWISVAVCVLSLQTWAATEFFADAVNGNDAWDGRAEVFDGAHGPKKTVQAAVDLAQNGSTVADLNIVTLLPGDYVEGETAVTSDNVVTSNRVVISSPIRLRSKNGRATRDTTRIVGAWDTSGAADVNYFMGPRAVRCVWVESTALGTRIEGITFLRGCATWGGDGRDHTHATGGGGVVFNSYGNRNGYVIDCAFVACIGTRGGGLYNGTAVRSLFTQCRASKYGTGARQIDAYNCVFADNIQCPGASEGNAALCYSYNVVNCTFVGNGLLGLSMAQNKGNIWNCTFQANASGSFPTSGSDSHTPKNCATTHESYTADGCAKIIDNEIFSPATGDYRLTAGATSTTVADAQWLEKIPDEFRNTDYYGNPRTNADGTVYAGAVQATAVPKGGKLEIQPQSSAYDDAGSISCNGHVCMRLLYEQGETWPRSVKLGWEPSPASDGSRALVRFKVNGMTQWPLADETAWVLAPESGTQQAHFQTGVRVFVDPVAGNDANDGSESSPFRTLQKAVDGRDGDAADVRAVIYARPGDYAEGATYFLGCSNRVHVAATAPLRICAVAGPDATFITGAPDTVTPLDNLGWGIGSNAVRCVSVAEGACCAFQGFTLRDGRGSQNAANSDCDAARGAAFLNGLNTTNYRSGWLLDCVVTNCFGSRGPGAYGGICERTYFTDCGAHGLGVFRYAELRSCVVAGMLRSQAWQILADISYAYNTTFYGNSKCSVGNAYARNCVGAGSVGVSEVSTTADRDYRYSVFEKIWMNNTDADLTGTLQADPVLNAPDQRDYRLVSGSLAMRAGSPAFLKSAMDFTGRPFSFDADGNVRAGAFEELVPGLRVDSSIAGTRKHEVLRVPPEGCTVPVTVDGISRPVAGIVVNGVTQDVSVTSLTVTPADAAAYEPFTVERLFMTHFYVDATNGDDAKSGASEATAWKTLAFASTNATWAGDVVTVLPGTYEEGSLSIPQGISGWSTAATRATRVVVHPGVTFESRDGAAATVVLGASATGTSEVDMHAASGCGVNAVRCAFVGSGGTLRGFTLRGGRTDYGSLVANGNRDLQGVDHMGGGVLGLYGTQAADFEEKYAQCLVEDCVIDDCRAPRGGAARYVRLRNCVVSNCGGINMGSCVRESMMENCLVTKTVSNGSPHFYNVALNGCTFLADNNGCTVSVDAKTYPNGIPAVNTAFCKKATLNGTIFTNCAFAAGMILSGTNDANVVVNCLYGVTDFGLDAEGRPTAHSPLLDAGDRTALPVDCATDRVGGQRVYNGQVDIGAYEYDWRPVFAACLVPKNLVVETADPSVTTNAAGKLVIPSGAVSATWTVAAASAKLPVEVTGTGTLSLYLNGALVQSVTAAEGPQTLKLSLAKTGANAFRFTYEPGTADTGAALLGALDYSTGCMLIIR